LEGGNDGSGLCSEPYRPPPDVLGYAEHLGVVGWSGGKRLVEPGEGGQRRFTRKDRARVEGAEVGGGAAGCIIEKALHDRVPGWFVGI